MENCEKYLEWISAHLDGQLSDEEERELEEHLDQCPTCRAIEERLHSGRHGPSSGRAVQAKGGPLI